jgi:hypothetical protein
MIDDLNRKLRLSLLLLRLSLGLVMMVWACDKIFNPDHGGAVLQSFYGIAGAGEQVVGPWGSSRP